MDNIESIDCQQVRVVQGEIRFLQTGNRKLFPVEIWALNDKTNRNGWRYTDMQGHLKEFRDIPILTAYTMGGKRVGDGHNFTMRIDPKTGEEYASFTDADAERIVGWVDADAEMRVERKDDTDWIVVRGNLWRYYAKELVDKIAGQGGGMEISIETLVTKYHMEGNVEVEDEYVVLGVTLLGDGVSPAVAGANIQSLAALSAVRNGMRSEILRAASYQKGQEQNPKTRKGVTRKMTKNRMANLSAKFDGYLCVGASEDGGKVALLSAKHEPYGYSFAESDNGNVIPERITQANATVTFRYNEEEVEVDLESVIDGMNRENADLQAEVNRLTEANNAIQSQLTAMVNREKARRLSAAKDTMNAALKEINDSMSDNEKYDAEILKDLSARIENGDFTDMEDKDGNWIGDKAIQNEVKVLCMDEQMRRGAQTRKVSYYGRVNGAKENTAPRTIGEKLNA